MDELKAKIITVIERVGATDMAAEIIIDLVKRGLGKMGGRPPNNRLQTPSKPVSNGHQTPNKRALARVSPDLGSSLDLPGSDLSKPNERDRELDEPKSEFARLLDRFCFTWKRRYGVDYSPTPADRNQLGKLIHGKTPAELAALPACFENYLNDLDTFVADAQRHNLTWFCTKGNGFNKYRTQAPVVASLTANNHKAGEQWLAMSEGAHGRKG